MYILQQNLQILWKERWRYFGVQECRIKFFDKISGFAHEWGCVVQKKLWSNQWKRCWATASTAKSARIDLCNYFSKRAMHWLIYLMHLDCDDDKYEEEWYLDHFEFVKLSNPK